MNYDGGYKKTFCFLNHISVYIVIKYCKWQFSSDHPVVGSTMNCAVGGSSEPREARMSAYEV